MSQTPQATSATPHLRELLQAHDVVCTEEGRWLRLGPSGPRAEAWFVNAQAYPTHCSVQLDVVLELWTGRLLIESFAGIANTAQEAVFLVLQGGVDVSRAVAAFVEPPDRDDEVILQELRAAGASPLEAEKLVAYIPLAFSQVLIGDLGARFPDSAWFVPEGTRSQHPVFLPEDPLWREALRLAKQAFTGGTLTREQFTSLAFSSSTAHAFNEALNAGSKPEDLVFSSPLIPLSAEAAAELRNPAPTIRSPPPAPPAPNSPIPPERPWWKFW